MTQFTKRALAEAMKSLMRIKPFEKITVVELVEACDINRQTFYYHFQDIYDLLGWMYRNEALAAIEHARSLGTWQQGLQIILNYVKDNEAICVNTYRSLARDHLESFLNEVLINLLGNVVDEIAAGAPLAPDHRMFITKFYSFAFCGVLLDWIRSGLKQPPEEIVDYIGRIVDGNVHTAIERFRDAR